MTPERLQEIRDHAARHAGEILDGLRWLDADRERVELLEYIDLLHEDLNAARRGLSSSR